MLKKPAILFCCSLLAGSLQLHATDEHKAFVNQEHEGTFTAESTSLNFEPFTGLVTGLKVRMRTQPSLEAHIVRETTHGEMFAVTGEAGDYYAVKPPKGIKGYIFRTFFLDGAIEGDRVNVRLSPDIEAPIVARLNTGDRVNAIPSSVNSKWLELELPENSQFFIAKEYIEKIGDVALVAQFEKKKVEAAHYLTAAILFAQSEIQKPFEQIDFDRIQSSFDGISKEYHDLPAIVEQIKHALEQTQDIYVQKKIAFLEARAGGKNYQAPHPSHPSLVRDVAVHEIASNASHTIGLTSSFAHEPATDKMLAWQPLEESLYHMWVAANGETSLEEFYSTDNQAIRTLSGIIEPYNRPVKNRPGDFLLKVDNLPVAFLYSTRINLEKLIGQQVTVVAAPRPNHHFAFPAYFVLNIE